MNEKKRLSSAAFLCHKMHRCQINFVYDLHVQPNVQRYLSVTSACLFKNHAVHQKGH